MSYPTRRHPARTAAALPQLLLLEGRTLFAAVPAFDHVVVVIEENHSPADVIGSNEAPYINSLAQNGAYLTQSFGTHRPSQPNYIALFSGSNNGVTSNADYNLGNVPNLGSQLIAAGKTFVNYSEDLPYVGFTGSTSGRYARKHNPSVSFSNVPAASNRPFTDFPSDYSTLPTVSFVVPNLDNDSHDGTVDTSDQWLEDKIGGYAEWAKSHNSLLVVTYDEGNLGDSTNHIATIFYGAGVKQGTYSNTVNHYNVLRTIEDGYGLAPLANAAGASPIDYIWNGTTPPPPPGVLAPTNLVAQALSGTQVKITWSDDSTNETQFKIERSTDGTNFSPLAAAGANATSYTNSNLAAGKKYYYRVYAVNATDRSGFSNVAFAVTPTGTTPPPTAPAAPTGLAASAASSSQINLTWADNATNETGYRVERGTDGTTFSPLATLGAGATSYANTNLPASTKYYYRVIALGGAGDSGFSNVASATTQAVSQPPPPPGAPAAPTNLVATSVSGTEVVISWADNSNNETQFKIERSTDGRTFSPLAASGANFTSYKNTGLTAGKRYYYRVYAINGSGKSAFTNVADAVAGSTGPTPPPPTVPAAPSGLAASAVSSSQINLTWADNSTNETGFRIERGTDGTNFGLLATVGAGVKSYSNANLPAGTRYYYRVLALGGNGNSGFSNVASAMTQSVGTPPPAGAPAAPTNLVLAKSTSVAGAINLSWADNATDETGYRIERSTDGKTFSPLAGGGANMAFYRNTGLTAGKRYYYRVYCINASGKSAFSNVASLVL